MYRKHYKKALVVSLLCAWLGAAHANDTVILNAGAPAYAATNGQASFGNAAIDAQWTVADGKLSAIAITDRDNGQVLKVDELFTLMLPNKQSLKSSGMQLLVPPSEQELTVDANASKLADRLPGKAIRAVFGDADHRFRVQWQLIQREGSPYLREEVIITALKQDEPLTSVSLLPSSTDHAEVDGVVKGSPVVAGNLYMGLENPLSDSEVRGKHVLLSMARSLPLRKGQSITYSAVVGAVRDGQLRRDFATYVERERAHPYRPFLHYNSWYDIGYFTPYTEAEALNRINTFGDELTVKRGVKLDSFLFDDGWDDRSGSWHFSKDFPHGFAPLRDAAAKYGAAPGMWLSPWGGYSTPKEERVKNGRAAGYEIVNDGLALSGPKYYQRFHEVVMKLLDEDGINQFKFDGTGNADSVFPAAASIAISPPRSS